MTITPDYALVGEIILTLGELGSWCGETHIQKTAFVAKELMHLPLSSEFILYKHGPYSFDLSGTLASMRADRILSLVPQGKYGPSYSIEPAFAMVSGFYSGLVRDNASKIRYVAKNLAGKNVLELEKLATAVYIAARNQSATVEIRAAELNRVKPHIDLQSAFAATVEADNFRRDAIKFAA